LQGFSILGVTGVHHQCITTSGIEPPPGCRGQNLASRAKRLVERNFSVSLPMRASSDSRLLSGSPTADCLVNPFRRRLVRGSFNGSLRQKGARFQEQSRISSMFPFGGPDPIGNWSREAFHQRRVDPRLVTWRHEPARRILESVRPTNDRAVVLACSASARARLRRRLRFAGDSSGSPRGGLTAVSVEPPGAVARRGLQAVPATSRSATRRYTIGLVEANLLTPVHSTELRGIGARRRPAGGASTGPREAAPLTFGCQSTGWK
jgi:hypothetical protein